MTDSSPAPGGDLGTPASGKLLKTLAITLAAAAVVFVVVILPAEYGIDPTRIGGLLGLDRLYEAAGTEPMAEAEEGLSAQMTGNRELRAETVTIEIGANEQMEYKLQMIEGMTIVYSWQTDGGTLYSDFHALRRGPAAPSGCSRRQASTTSSSTSTSRSRSGLRNTWPRVRWARCPRSRMAT